MTKAKIEVFENSLSSKVVATFKTIEALVQWNKKENIFADRIAVNGCVLLGWDELYDFVLRMKKRYSTFEGESYTTKGLKGRGLFTVKMMDTTKRTMEEIDGGFRYVFCQVQTIHRESEGTELNRFYRIKVDHSSRKVLKKLYPLGH